jgi:hypothetical protein
MMVVGGRCVNGKRQARQVSLLFGLLHEEGAMEKELRGCRKSV